MPEEQIAQALGFDNLAELHASEFWKMWKKEGFGGDAYWLQVLAAVQSGDRLSASERVGGLLFQVVDGKMRIFGENGATSTNLWDWQGAGFYTIDRPGSDDRADAVFSDIMFGFTSNQNNPFYHYQNIPQYQYSGGDANSVSASLVGIGVLGRRPQFQFSGVVSFFGDAAPVWDYVIDAAFFGAGLIPQLTVPALVISGGKLVVDLGISVYQTFAGPVYRYRME